MTSLNLYTKGDGIDGTHISWEDIESAMRESLSTRAVFGDNKSYTNIGEGKGNLSSVLLINPDWQNVANEESLPDKFVAKLSSMLKVISIMSELRGKQSKEDEATFYSSMEINSRKLHNAECTAYEQMMKHKINFPSAKIYYVQRLTDKNPVKGMILMECMNELVFPPMYQNFTIDETKQVLQAAAKWSATSLKFSLSEINQFPPNPLTTIFKDFYNPQSIEYMANKTKTFNNGILKIQSTRMDEILPEILDFESFDRIPDELQMKRVLCHGDLWNYNILWRQHGDQLKLASIIDYQTAHFGSPAADIIRILCSAVGGKERQDNFEDIVKYYYEQFIEEVDGEAPFTFEQLYESCKRYFPLGAYMIVSTMPAEYDMMMNDLESDERQKAMLNFTDKCCHMYEDIFFYHNRNMARKKKI